jgi:tRNA 2-selenouridine synthase SelU
MLILQLKKRVEDLESQILILEQKINALQLPTTMKEKSTKFVKPTVVEIFEYASERLNHEDALKFTEKFHAHYESNGWKVGRSAMKDWKAAVRKWDLSTFDTSKTNQNQIKIKNGKFDSDAAQRIYNDAHNISKG